MFGKNILPTLVSGYYKMVGNTQDGLTICILGEDDEKEDSIRKSP